jgi:hypothetical protein
MRNARQVKIAVAFRMHSVVYIRERKAPKPEMDGDHPGPGRRPTPIFRATISRDLGPFLSFVAAVLFSELSLMKLSAHLRAALVLRPGVV